MLGGRVGIYVSLKPREKILIEEAARLQGYRSLSKFVRDHLMPKVRQIIEEGEASRLVGELGLREKIERLLEVALEDVLEKADLSFTVDAVGNEIIIAFHSVGGRKNKK